MKKWSWLIRFLLFAVILAGVSYQFFKIVNSETLQNPEQTDTPAEILLGVFRKVPFSLWFLSGFLYTLGILNSWWLWHWLATRMGDRMHWLGSAFAISYSQLGKYAPGKGLAMMIRVAWAAQAGGRIPIAAVSAVYEVLTTMASGSLIGLLLGLWFYFKNEQGEGAIPAPLWHAGIMFILSFIPVTPPIFNRLAVRLAGRFMNSGQAIRQPNWYEMGVGLILSSFNWMLLGTSLFLLVLKLPQDLPLWGVEGWLHCVQYISLANVGGFIASTPGGIGVREFLLQQYLAPHLGLEAVVLVLLIRFIWTIAEICLLVILWIARRLVLKKVIGGVP